MRSTLLALVLSALGLAFGTSAQALSSSPSQDHGNGYSVQLSHSGGGFFIDFSDFQFSRGRSGYEHYLTAAIDRLRARGIDVSRFLGGHDYQPKPPRDAGYVPEPGAVGVFSVGLLVAGALIRRLGRKA